MSVQTMLEEAKQRPCRCARQPVHTFGECILRTIDEHIDVLNRLESHLGCVVCRGPLHSAGRCKVCQPLSSDEIGVQ